MEIPDQEIRDQFLCLFSTTLEFNNLFCSFKGEGTGAVRHMFSHHILKPERAPLENNIWGTPQSSGSFSRLFKSKLLKAKQYLDEPFELQLDGAVSDKATSCIASAPINVQVTTSWEEFSTAPHRALVLNGDSSVLPIPDRVVDAVVTDPPYFDFIHYSELSDFFFAWLAPVLAEDYPYFARSSSFHEGEVQNKEPVAFASNLGRVFAESSRVLKDNGVLVFSFHHSRSEGWAAIYRAIRDGGFHVVAAYPVYAEMKGASPKTATRDPISVDIILVCKKAKLANRSQQRTTYQRDLSRAGIKLSKADHFNIHAGIFLIEAGINELPAPEIRERLAKLKTAVIL
jgi:putative DNA methylase